MPFKRGADMLLAALVVGIIGMMILPLPTWLLDILITFNITIAVVLLLTATYVTDILRISSFPTILLITTLFRLALNVSSTRLILLQADAGEVIRSFGSFVVGGNYVVGAVIFVVLTLIQFIVVAKGAERVAEVSARFTLDAMPGKQMAIDADLRAGAVDMDEARRRRREVQRESELYGSMDGAMKFVKGDAIAGILIAVVNIVAGLVIGVTQRNLEIGEAAKVYTLLTIGDGLVSQIPALLITVAAGLVVTRVKSEEAGQQLADEIGGQVLGHPRAVAMAAGLLLLLAVVPGMPTLPFVLLGAGSGFLAYRLSKRAAAASAVVGDARAAALQGKLPGARDERDDRYLPVVTPILVEVASDLAAAIEGQGGATAFLKERVPALRDEVFHDLGLRLPAVRLVVGGALPPGTYRIRLHEVPVCEGQIPHGAYFVPMAADALPPLERTPVAAQLPGTDRPGAWVDVLAARPLAEAGIPLWDAPTTILKHLGVVARRRAGEFLGLEEVQQMLDQVEKVAPASVREVVPKLLSLFRVTDVLRRMLDEQIPIRDMRAILNALADYAQNEKDPAMLAEYARTALKRQVSHRFSRADGTLAVYLLDPDIEEAIRGAVQKTPVGQYLALDPNASSEILAAFRRILADRDPSVGPPVVVTNVEVRRFLRKLVEIEFPDLVVLSYHELANEASLQPLGRVMMAEGA
ncbi:MAG: type III secretion system export apparatus subunit SctV [Deltaproteobacteria bacterium]|nr:type III secretion system export apparatus subunit SctV [Deltaproteobacteria bacterium]